jgi:aspartokinase
MPELYSCKFGGNSVKTAANQRNIRDRIVRSDERRRALTVSALKGTTNMLIAWDCFGYPHPDPEIRKIMAPFRSKDAVVSAIEEEHATLVRELGIHVDITSIFNNIRDEYRRLENCGDRNRLSNFAWCQGEIVNAHDRGRTARLRISPNGLSHHQRQPRVGPARLNAAGEEDRAEAACA